MAKQSISDICNSNTLLSFSQTIYLSKSFICKHNPHIWKGVKFNSNEAKVNNCVLHSEYKRWKPNNGMSRGFEKKYKPGIWKK